MEYHIDNTIKQLFSIVMFCKKVNIPFDVYAFTTQWKIKSPQVPKIGDLVVGDFALLNLFLPVPAFHFSVY